MRLLLPAEVSEPLRGDLEEEHGRRAALHGSLRAACWYWLQVARLPYRELARAAARARRGGEPRRSRGHLPDALDRVLGDLRVASRNLRLRPGFSLVVVGTFAASLAAATLVVSALEALWLRPLPYPDADRLVTIYAVNQERDLGDQPQLREFLASYPLGFDQLEAARDAPALRAVGGAGALEVVLQDGDGPRRIAAAMVAPGLFETLGVSPELGRTFSREELATAAPVVVVSHALWSERLNADPRAIGRALDLDGRAHTVVGVMPRGFFYPSPEQRLWIPLPAAFREQARKGPLLHAVGRLAPGASVERASGELGDRARVLAEQDSSRAAFGMRAVSSEGEALEQAGRGLALFAGAVALVVVLAAVNVASLVLTRTHRRRSELAIRRALGARRGTLVCSILAEVLLLALVGGALGVGAAALLLDPFARALDSVEMLRGTDVRMNAAVLAFAGATTLLAALGAGVPVALRVSRQSPADRLRGGVASSSERTHRAQRLLLAVESGVALVLLAGAALLLRSVLGIAAVDAGYRLAGLHFLELEPALSAHPDDAARVELFERVARRVSASTGAAVTLVEPVLSVGEAGIQKLRVTPTAEPQVVPASGVGPEFFHVARLPILRGRGFGSADERGAPPVVVVSETLARRLAPEADAVGERMLVGEPGAEREVIVAGVAADARVLGLPMPGGAHLYLPLSQWPTASAALLVRQPEGRPLPSLRAIALEEDPQLLVGRAGSLRALSLQVLSPVYARAGLVGACAALALLLAAVGIAAAAAQVVEEHTREIGIRIALGAAPAAETGRVARHFLLTIGAGSAVGLACALAATRTLASFLYEVDPFDPISYVAAALAITWLGGLAAWIPARRAARVDPVEVLRRD